MVENLKHVPVISNLLVSCRILVIRPLVRNFIEPDLLLMLLIDFHEDRWHSHGIEVKVNPWIAFNIVLGVFNVLPEPFFLNAMICWQPGACAVHVVLIWNVVFVSVLMDHPDCCWVGYCSSEEKRSGQKKKGSIRAYSCTFKAKVLPLTKV